MSLDHLIDQLLQQQEETSGKPMLLRIDGTYVVDDAALQHREIIASLASEGQFRQFLGSDVTANHVDAVDNEEIESLHACNEAWLAQL